jgi:hypothetical protein
MEKVFGKELLARQLVDLDRHEIAVRLCENGKSRVPFQARTLPSLGFRVGAKEKLIARSRERFATIRATVENTLARWIEHGRSNINL